MKKVEKFLFPTHYSESLLSVLLLVVRLLVAGLLLWHGVQKWIHFDALQTTFVDPLGVGSRFSLMLVIAIEVFCSGFVLLGLLTRPMLVPMIVAMFVAFVAVHHGDHFAAKELSFIFLTLFAMLLVVGPGRYSMDWVVGRLLAQE